MYSFKDKILQKILQSAFLPLFEFFKFRFCLAFAIKMLLDRYSPKGYQTALSLNELISIIFFRQNTFSIIQMFARKGIRTFFEQNYENLTSLV